MTPISYYGYYISLLTGIGYVAERNKAQVVAGVFRILLTGFLLFMGWDLLGACIAYLLYGLILRIISRNYFLKAINTTLGDISYIKIQKSECINIFHTIWPNTWRDGMVSVSDYLCTQAGTIISSLYLSLPETGIYSLSVQLITAIAKIARSFQIAYIPALQTAYITDNEKDLKEINSMCILVYCVVYIAGVLALYVIGIPLLRLIKPDLSIDRIILLFIAILQFMVVLRNCYASFLSTTNRVHYWRAFIISGLLSVFLSMVILSYWKIGVWGIILPAIIVELLYNFWHWPILVSRELKVGFKDTVCLGFRKLNLLFKKGENA